MSDMTRKITRSVVGDNRYVRNLIGARAAPPKPREQQPALLDSLRGLLP